VHRLVLQAAQRTLTVEVLDDDLIRFGLDAGKDPSPSPMIARRVWPGPRKLEVRGSRIRTDELELEINPTSLQVTATDRRTGARLTSIRPAKQGLTIARAATRNVYGLGQQLVQKGGGDWLGRVRRPGNEHGNRMVPFQGGAVGNTQIPILYALGQGLHNYALFVDQPEAQTWDLSKDPWRLSLKSEEIRWYLLAGPDLADLRRDYMELTGRPPVPPQSAFGLWVSEYGYRNWGEVEAKLATLRQKAFPVDGFVLDLFWFGGVEKGSPSSRMGSLRWDTAAFPDPKQKIQELRQKGIGVVVIEESYISKALPEYRELAKAGYLVRRCGKPDCPPESLDSWWGLGGMIDWTNPAAGDFWHDHRRAALVDAGVMGHWTDLGEPEDYSATGWYHGFGHTHDAVANLYNFAWLESIHRGYGRRRVQRRPVMLSRSGTAGVQRFGAALWSGDIGSNMASLRAHLDAQLHLSLSGIDYYGSDVGGFHRSALDGDVGKLYTQWLACSLALDLPVRPHTVNLERKHETAPDRIGNLKSNLENLRLRYRLRPYLYTLAHRAHRTGEAVFPPLVYHFQRDFEARRITRQKMMGPHLMVALVTGYDVQRTRVYLPGGTWFDYHSGKRHRGGRWLGGVNPHRAGHFQLPLFARAGAIIPEQRPDKPGRLIVRVFPDSEPSETTLYEDDGESVAYLQGAVRTTRITQRPADKKVTVEVHPAQGTFQGAPSQREIEVLIPADVQSVLVDGTERGMGYWAGYVSIRLGSAPVSQPRRVEFRLRRP
jgi:alpha-glucosidase